MIKTIRTMFSDFFRLFIIYMPGETGRKIRFWYYKKRFKRCGKGLKIEEGVIITNPDWISVGDNVCIDKYSILLAGPINWEGLFCKERKNRNFTYTEGELIIGDNVEISPFCIFQAHGGLFIGKNNGFSAGVKIYSTSGLTHKPGDRKMVTASSAVHKDGPHCRGAIVLEENVGVALHSILLPGVTIGKNSVVIPMSMVFTSFPENSYIGGNPARRIRDRFKYE